MKLPARPSADLLVRLIRARQFLEHAKSHAAGATDVDFMIATHSADNAVEFILKLVGDHIQYEDVSGAPLPDVELGSIAASVSKFMMEHYGYPLPYLREIKALRQVRNLVQHGAFAPGADVARSLKMADRFFTRVCDLVFGMAPQEIFVSTVVVDAHVKRHLRAAEELIAQKRYEDAVRASRNALEEAQFKYRKHSPVALHEIPARVELAPGMPNVGRFLSHLSSELDALRLKMDANSLGRFREITRHLPSEPGLELGGHTVMQRQWEASDAEFCYGFVSENVLRWQEQEYAPLYEIEWDSPYRHVETIDGIPISECDSGCYYMEDDHDIQLFYGDTKVRERLMALESGRVYKFSRQRYKDDQLELDITYLARLRFVESQLLTHDPVRWQIVLDTSVEPLTWHRSEYADGKLVGESASLGTCTEADLVDLYPVDEDVARLILAAREVHGILTSEVLRQVQGITDDQVRWIESHMRA